MFYALIVIVVAAAIALKFLQSRQDDDNSSGSGLQIKVNSKQYFFTKAETGFYKALLPIASEMGLTVCPKVGLWDVFDDARGAPKHQANRYKQKHVDFLLLKGPMFQPVAGIELDGNSHQSDRQKSLDLVKDEVFRSAKLPLLRFQNQQAYDQGEIRSRLNEVLATAAV
jgi:hypothetical protein